MKTLIAKSGQKSRMYYSQLVESPNKKYENRFRKELGKINILNKYVTLVFPFKLSSCKKIMKGLVRLSDKKGNRN